MIISVLDAEGSLGSHGLGNGTTFLLDFDGVSVMRVERCEDGGSLVHLATADASTRACPTCGIFSSRGKGSATTRPGDHGERGLEFWWHKRRRRCRELACARKSFTEQIPAGARLTGSQGVRLDVGHGTPAPQPPKPPAVCTFPGRP